jgi:transcriptional regulator with PAS, ATPase and Fis domain
VKEKTFREDLYYRINVIEVHLPPLRERKDDIPLLAHHFMQEYARHIGRNTHRISQEVLSLLMEYDWPGNVRELQNAIQHAVALTRDDTISPLSLPSHIRAGTDDISVQSPRERMSLYELKKAYTLQMLEEHSWNCAKAAAALGIGKATIYRKLKEYGFTRL